MNSPYVHLAELFGMRTRPEADFEKAEDARVGKTAEESARLGRERLDAGDLEAAIEHFKREVRQRESEDIDGRLDLAGAFEAADMAPQALRQYERALKVRADTAEAHLGLSQVLKRNARQRDSIDALEKAIGLEPTNPFFHYKLAELLRGMGARERALIAAQGAVVVAPDDAFYHFWVGDLLIEMRRFDDALDALQAAIELSPGDDYLYLRAAVAFWGAGKPDKAVHAVRLASELDPDKHLYHGLLEALLARQGDHESAALESERASQMEPYDRDALRRVLGEMGL
ncbi:MAG: tetratricopeptide repeat protein [Fimbriimonadaceae bacterium]|nr:tetratricopeptide repeat protein [Fimbriimonadaceae bacterium]